MTPNEWIPYIPLIIFGIIILCCIIGIIDVFIKTLKRNNEIVNENYQCGRAMSKQKLRDEIVMLKNKKTKWNSSERTEIKHKIYGLKKALEEKINEEWVEINKLQL